MCVISEPVVWTDPFTQQARAYVVAQRDNGQKGVFVLSDGVSEDDFNYYLLRHLEQQVQKVLDQTARAFIVSGVTLDETEQQSVRFNHIVSDYESLDKDTITKKICTNDKYLDQFKDFIIKLSMNVDHDQFVCAVVKYR